MLYLISASDYRIAVRIAQREGLQPAEWVFVPQQDSRRLEILQGRIGYDLEHLIGRFSDLEVANLCRKA